MIILEREFANIKSKLENFIIAVNIHVSYGLMGLVGFLLSPFSCK